MPSRIGEKDVESAVTATSLLIWVPHLVGLTLSFWNSTASTQITMGLSAAVVFAATAVIGPRFNGDVLMVLMFLVGLFSEFWNTNTVEEASNVPRNWWLLISAAQGLIAAVLCKTKDMQDGRYFEFHTAAERLYLVTPFTVGIWFGYVVMTGFAGVIRVISSVFFCLALVGYGVLIHRLLAWGGVYQMDLIGLVNRLFTTSFGIVFASLGAAFVGVTYLAIPFMTALLELNGALSCVGILVEIVLYDLA